jgi:hypothetical protein
VGFCISNFLKNKKGEKMFPVEEWSKEQVYSVMRELLYSFNYTWFLAEEWIKRNCGPKQARDGMLYLAGEFGTYEAKRLSKTIPEDLKGIDRMIRYLSHSHWAAFEDIEIKRVSENSFVMATLGCTSQKAAVKWGLGRYDCSEVALKLRKSFFQSIDSRAQVVKIFTPPSSAVDGFAPSTSCAWLISLERSPSS